MVERRENPLLSSLPNHPKVEFWSSSQWDVFFSLLDAAVPSITVKPPRDGNHHVRIAEYEYDRVRASLPRQLAASLSETELLRLLAEGPSQDPVFQASARRVMSNISPSQQNQLGGVLNLLSGHVGTFLLTGHCTAFTRLPALARCEVLESWQRSRLAAFRSLSKTLTTVARLSYSHTSTIFHQIVGYAEDPPDIIRGTGYGFEFLQFPQADEPVVLEFDAVIVGSGPGGSVCAKRLAEAGQRVLVVDKSYYFPPSQLPMPQEAGMHHLFENHGSMPADDLSIVALAGSCWGGGGTVNWSVSLETQDYVRAEWSERNGLPFFTTPKFQECIDKVCETMGVTTKNIRHNHANRVLLDGASKLGWRSAATPINSGGADHYCGQCHLGCGSNNKRGTLVSYLPAAAKAGAKFLEGFQVHRVMFDPKGGKKKATGVAGTWTSRDKAGQVGGGQASLITRDVVVNAKKVIVSAGSFWSPVILSKSGVQNPQLGKNLHLHPCNLVAGFFDERTNPWEGGIITSYCSEFENLDGHGHGVKIEPSCMLPYTFLTNIPAKNGLEFKLAALKYPYATSYITLTRDRDSGRVYPDPTTGLPRMDYTPSKFDSAHMLEGIVAACRILRAANAAEIQPMIQSIEPFRRDPRRAKADDDKAFEVWIDGVRKAGNTSTRASRASAHQMSTCRMSSREHEGVVDPRGRVWGCDNLYVADASVLPSASGVNPMITTMAIAEWIAEGVEKDMDKGQHS